MTDYALKERLTETIKLLSVPGIGRGRFHRLVKRFGSPEQALAATMDRLEAVAGISRNLAGCIKSAGDGDNSKAITDKIIELGWTALFPEFDQYPPLLKKIHDHPPLLFRLGKPLEPAKPVIAIVGTRNATDQGRRFAYELAYALASKEIEVVSGMAEGIDSAAHKGALDAGGSTSAVWGSSLDIIFPAGNRALAKKIEQNGSIYSEYLPETKPDRTTFPQRNRIISGMTDGVVVVEAGHRSGALITAACAIEQNRELFAVPGTPLARRSQGTNDLIKKGARLLTSIDDIFEELPRLKGKVISTTFSRLPQLTDSEISLIKQLDGEPVQIDQLSRQHSIPIDELMPLLLALEMKGVVTEFSGKRFALCETYS